MTTGRSCFLSIVRRRSRSGTRRRSIRESSACSISRAAAEPTRRTLFLVAPDDREDDVRAQLRRPAFGRIAILRVRYLRYSDLAANRQAMARFGQRLKPIEALARNVD